MARGKAHFRRWVALRGPGRPAGPAISDCWRAASRWSPTGRGAIEAAGSWASQAFVQEIVDCRSVLRVHATDDQVLGAFARPAATITGLALPDPVERPVEVTLSHSKTAPLRSGFAGAGAAGTRSGAGYRLRNRARRTSFVLPTAEEFPALVAVTVSVPRRRKLRRWSASSGTSIVVVRPGRTL